MKKCQHLFVLGCSSVLLVACGGGGASLDGGSAPMTNRIIPTIQPLPSTLPNAPTKTDSTIQGNSIRLNAANDLTTRLSSGQTNATDHINNVVIDGKSIAFYPNGTSAPLLNITETHRARLGGNSQFSYMRYGYLREGVGTRPYLFAQGHVTNNMPNTGTARYIGFATHLQDNTLNAGISEFNVDFARKTVKGKISPLDVAVVELEGTINGNRFSGSKNGFVTNGAFYGNSAAELGGTYQNRLGTISGAYGAKKQ